MDERLAVEANGWYRVCLRVHSRCEQGVARSAAKMTHFLKFQSDKVGSKSGKRSDLGDKYFRSRWEANIARYLNWLQGIGAVKEWHYEADCFEFHKIRKGNRFYTPDFKIMFSRDEDWTYWEVKGYMDDSSKTKLARMSRYYPQIKIILIDDKAYRNLAKECRTSIPNWE